MTRRSLRDIVVWVAICAASATLVAQDWPQFLGPQRDGTYIGPPITDGWSGGGPTRLWERQVGAGFAGPVVVGGRLILFHRIGRLEVVEALATGTGQTVWRYDYPTTYRDDFGFDEGPRSVPVVVDGRVYTFGAQGQLHAVDLETGEGIWSHDTHDRYGVRKGFFGAAGSPLVENGRVIANVGGRRGGIVAFNAITGEELWTATTDEASYSSPVGATFGGRRHALFFTRTGLVGLDPESGDVLFQKRWRDTAGGRRSGLHLLQLWDRRRVAASGRRGARGRVARRRHDVEPLRHGSGA